jgi:hypothetical protein
MSSQEQDLYLKKGAKKSTSSPLEEFLEEKKFTPDEKKQILTEWEIETNKELLYYKENPPKWASSSDEKKSSKNNAWDTPEKYKNKAQPIVSWDKLAEQNHDWGEKIDSAEIFGKDIEEEEEEVEKKPKKLTQPQIEFEKLVDTFFLFICVGNS